MSDGADPDAESDADADPTDWKPVPQAEPTEGADAPSVESGTGTSSEVDAETDTEASTDADATADAGTTGAETGTDATAGSGGEPDSEAPPERATEPEATGSLVWAKIRSVFEFEHSHSAGTRVVVLALAVVLAVYASWLLADLGGRTLTFLVIAAAGTYSLYARPTPRDVVIRGLYSLAILLVLTPILLNVTFLLASSGTGGVANPWRFVFSMADLLYLVVFALFAAVPAGIAYLLDRRR